MNTNIAIDYKHIATTNVFELSFCDPPKTQYLPNYKIIYCDGAPMKLNLYIFLHKEWVTFYSFPTMQLNNFNKYNYIY
jgi:hypothetical protein